MEIHSGHFLKKFVAVSIISIIFLVSCNQEEVGQKTDTSEWYTKLGFKEVMKQMKKDTRLLSRKIASEEWEESKELCKKISNSFHGLDLENPEIPEEFSEFKKSFDDTMAKLLLVCEGKEVETTKIRLDAVKQSCRSCHIRFRKELDIFNEETDHGVALEKLFKGEDKK